MTFKMTTKFFKFELERLTKKSSMAWHGCIKFMNCINFKLKIIKLFLANRAHSAFGVRRKRWPGTKFAIKFLNVNWMCC